MGLIKYVALGDLHYGWDKKVSPMGRPTRHPVHEIAAFQAMMKFVKDFKPDRIYLMGDMFDMRPVCRHEIHLAKAMEGQRLREMYEKGNEFFLEPCLKTGAEVHWLDANHEAWAYQLAAQFPGVDGIIDPANYLEMKKRGVVLHPLGSIIKVGRLALAHGDTIVKGSVKYAAQRAVERYCSSIRVWHFHTYQAFTKETLKNMAYQTGVAVPCLCNRGPSYEATSLNGWMHGFNYGFVENSGEFHDYVVVIWRGRFHAPSGVLYDGNKS